MATGLVDKSFVSSSDELFYLKWNNFQKNVSTQFEKLREEDDLVDITFACEGKKLTAHKLVLFACSPFFKDLLKKNPSPHPVFFMNDVKYDVLKAILEYMYLGEVHITNENLKDFIKTAEGLQIRGLSKENNGDIVMPPANQQIPIRKEEKETTVVESVLLDEFCRKRPEPGEITHTTVGLNIKRMKTVDTQIPSVSGQDNVSNVEPKVEMVEYLETESTNHQSPTYCSMDNYTEKSNSRNNIAHMSQLNTVQAVVMPFFTYCDVVYHPGLSVAQKEQLNRCFKAAVRFVYRLRRRESTEEVRNTILGHDLATNYRNRICSFMRQGYAKDLPDYLLQHLQRGTQERTRCFTIPAHTTSQRKSILIAGAFSWIGVPLQIKLEPTINSFKAAVKRWQ